jgi:hypothetical protein
MDRTGGRRKTGFGGKLVGAPGAMRYVATTLSPLQARLMAIPAPTAATAIRTDGDRLRRQRATDELNDDERDRSPQPDRYDAVGEVSGACRTQERHRRQVQRRIFAHMRTTIAMAVSGRNLKK